MPHKLTKKKAHQSWQKISLRWNMGCGGYNDIEVNPWVAQSVVCKMATADHLQKNRQGTGRAQSPRVMPQKTKRQPNFYTA